MKIFPFVLIIFLLIGSMSVEARYSPGLEMAGNISMGGYYLTGLPNPSVATDAAPWKSVQGANSTRLPLSGGTMTGNIAMGGYKVTGLANGTAAQDAITRSQFASRPLSYIKYTKLESPSTSSTATTWTSINATTLNLSFVTQNAGMARVGFYAGCYLQNVHDHYAYFTLYVDGANIGDADGGLVILYDYTKERYSMVDIEHFVYLNAGSHTVEPKWKTQSGGENIIDYGFPIFVYAEPMF